MFEVSQSRGVGDDLLARDVPTDTPHPPVTLAKKTAPE
jgi:hypothetical protein